MFTTWMTTLLSPLVQAIQAGITGLVSAGSSPTVALGSHSASVVGPLIFTFGGFNSTSGYINQIHQYNTVTNIWTTGVGSFSSNRGYMATAAADSLVYYGGGVTASTGSPITYTYFSSWAVFDTTSKASTVLTSMPNPRWGGICEIVGTNIYLIGGYRNSNSTLSTTIDIFSTVNRTWSSIPVNASITAGSESTVIGTDIYIQTVGNLLKFDTIARTWETLSSINTNTTYHSIQAIGTNIYSLGGLIGGSTPASNANVLRKYDTVANLWSIVDTSGVALPKIRAFSMNTIAGKLYLFGGYDTDKGNYSNALTIIS